MNKIKYARPEMEIVVFENEDVIIASNPGIELPDDDLSKSILYGEDEY